MEEGDGKRQLNEEKRKSQEQERRTPSETVRMTLLNGSSWSTEKKFLRRYKGTFDN